MSFNQPVSTNIPTTKQVTTTAGYSGTTNLTWSQQPGGGGGSAAIGAPTNTQPMEDLAAITVTSRIPEFWKEMPRLWFAQFDSIMAPQKQSDETKFNVVVSKLSPDVLQQVSDILFNPPGENKYQTLRDRLLHVYEESAGRQFRKLLSELELGSQKPSQLLRRMIELGRNSQISEPTLCNLWLGRLPPAVRAGLAVTEEKNLMKLGGIADKIMENICTTEIAAINNNLPTTSYNTDHIFTMTELLSQMNKLSAEVAAFA